ncbi:UNVERIFIED_CONTAM: hypothetical protein Sindi_1958000 [Sesamum indicum]
MLLEPLMHQQITKLGTINSLPNLLAVYGIVKPIRVYYLSSTVEESHTSGAAFRPSAFLPKNAAHRCYLRALSANCPAHRRIALPMHAHYVHPIVIFHNISHICLNVAETSTHDAHIMLTIG